MAKQLVHLQVLLSLLGIIGGLTSVITSTVEGVKTEGGVSGFISGLGKGLVGTVTKPMAGALDFASETAQAVRDTASLSGPRSVNTLHFLSINCLQSHIAKPSAVLSWFCLLAQWHCNFVKLTVYY